MKQWLDAGCQGEFSPFTGFGGILQAIPLWSLLTGRMTSDRQYGRSWVSTMSIANSHCISLPFSWSMDTYFRTPPSHAIEGSDILF